MIPNHLHLHPQTPRVPLKPAGMIEDKPGQLFGGDIGEHAHALLTYEGHVGYDRLVDLEGQVGPIGH